MQQQLLSKTRPLRPSACAQVPRLVCKACRQARSPVTRPCHGAAAADRSRSVVVPAAAAQDAVPEDDDDGVDQEGAVDGLDADAYAEPPFDEESVRERQLMAAEAGPSDAAAAADDEGEEEQEFEELQEPPFPEPELRPMLLCDLLGLAAEEEVAAIAHNTFPDLQIAGLSDDPASVMPGDMYCCVERITRSSVWNGHDPEAVAAALAAGAVAILAEAGTDFPDGLIPDSVPVIYADEVDELATRLAAVLHESPGSNDRSMTVLSVLGTNGKTTTSWLIRGLLEQAGQLTGMVGSIEYALAEHLMNPDGSMWMPEEPDPAAGRECSSPFHLVPYKGRYWVEETTPSGLRVQKVLAGMRDRGATAAVLEVDTEALATGSLAWVQPTISVFTNLGHDPCSMFSSKEEYLEVLLEHFRELQDGSKQRAVVNIDDEAAAAVLQAASGVPCITFGINNAKADVRVESLDLSLWRTTMIVATPVGRLEIITNLVGRHNVYNVLAAVAVGVLLNLPLEDIGAGIESVQFVPGRCEVVNNELELFDAEEGEEQPPPAAAKLPKDFAVAVDAANTPQRLAQVLDDLREAGAKRIFTVFGADGQVTTGESRARMGEVAHQRSDFVILTDTDPGLEDPKAILQDIVSGWPNELFEPYAAYVYNVFQSQNEVPLWFEPYLHSAQRRWKRHIMASRFQAIRAAIGTATAGDVVLLAGRGHKDWVEQVVQGQLTRGWLDDRVEARNALAKLEYLYALVDLDRSELIWGPNPSDGKTAVVEFE